MTVDERVERTVERIRAAWGVGTAIGLVAVLVMAPWWAIPIFFLFSIGTYFGSLFLAGMFLAATIKPEDHPNETVAVGESEQGFTKENVEAVGLVLGDVASTGEIFGTYLDQPMFEWIDVVADKQGKLARYLFEQVTPRDRAGNLLLPRQEGFACYNGVTYKLGQPA
jgi:hypothetical protein